VGLSIEEVDLGRKMKGREIKSRGTGSQKLYTKPAESNRIPNFKAMLSIAVVSLALLM